MKGHQYLLRILLGGLLGAVLAPVLVYFMGPVIPSPVMPAMAQAFGSIGLAALIQSLLGGVFGGVVAIATLPFADDGMALSAHSLAHFGMTAVSFSVLLWICRWVDRVQLVLQWVALLAVLYLLIWLGRWVGWYVEVTQLRILLGLDPGPSPLKWRETLPYLPFVLLVCNLLPALLRWLDPVDVPALSGVLLPFVLLPAAGFFSGLSLGKRQGMCVLYPVACFMCYLPTVFLLLNESALFHCFMVAIPALIGNVMGMLYRRAVPKKR